MALTYDDGPIPGRTDAVLAALDRAGVPATFFTVGYLVRSYPDIVRRTVDSGHVVANHTYRHEILTYLSNSGIVSTIDRADAALRATGVNPARLVRPPGGNTNSRVKSAIEGAGYRQVMWTWGPLDYKPISAWTISSGIINHAKDGAVFVLHDGSGNYRNTAAAVDRIVSTLHARGYCFGVLDNQGNIVPSGSGAPAEPEVDQCAPPTQTAPDSAGVGVVDTARGFWYLRDPLNVRTTGFYYGNPGDYPFMGDWDGDGVDTPGLYRRSDGYVYLRNSNTSGIADVAFLFGNPGDLPVPGDFNGDGFDTVSLYRPDETRFYIINQLGSGGAGLGAADYEVSFGSPGDQPIAGDFDGDGVDTVGIYRSSSGLVSFAASPATSFFYGSANDYALMGAYEGGAKDTIGVYRENGTMFYLRSSNTSGAADHEFSYGKRGFIPIVGYFGDLHGTSMPPQSDVCEFPVAES